jgi:cutinase
MMNTISKLPDNIKKKVAGVVLFGYTKNGQTKSSIPNYPKENVMVLCSSSDGVCGGALLVTVGHFSYMADGSGPKAVNFLVGRINSAGSSSGSSGVAKGIPKGKGIGGAKGNPTQPPPAETVEAAE